MGSLKDNKFKELVALRNPLAYSELQESSRERK